VPSQWSWRDFVRAHKRGSAIALAAVVLAIAFIGVSVAIGSHGAPLDDATPCSDWGTASAAQQQAYARLWLSEYGPLTRAGTTPAAVRASITAACSHAALLAEADEVTVYAAIHRRY
jgi:hypothetical protein